MAETSSSLAQLIRRRLKGDPDTCPSIKHLKEFFEVLFYASLRTEEASHISCDLVWLDPNNPDPDPPERVLPQRWRFFRFQEPLAFSVNALTKAAAASDPRSGSFAVFPDNEGILKVWGLVDQSLSHEKALHHEKGSSFARPGLFQARIIGIGKISVWQSSELIGELRGESLVRTTQDVFRSGPVRTALNPHIEKFADYACARHMDLNLPDDYARHSLATKWIQALARLLIRIEGYGHGGALILTSAFPSTSLSVKYGLYYDGVPIALAGAVMHEIDGNFYQDMILDIAEDKEVETVPIGLHFGAIVAVNEEDDHQEALEGSLWFASLFSKVDGAVICDSLLAVQGYGAVIKVEENPEKVFIASNAPGTIRREINPDQYGTRHRSMIRYCLAHPGSIGFVISQDGGVKAMLAEDRNVLIWDNIRLRREYRLRKRPKKR